MLGNRCDQSLSVACCQNVQLLDSTSTHLCFLSFSQLPVPVEKTENFQAPEN